MIAATVTRTMARAGNPVLRGALLLAASVAVFVLSRHGMTHLAKRSEPLSYAAVALAFGLATLLRGIRYADLTPALRVTLRGLGIVVLVQVLFDTLGPFAGPPNLLFGGSAASLSYRCAAVIAIAAGSAALWRPAFLMPLFLYYVAWRTLIGTLSGIAISDTDYLGMIDVGYFGIVGALLAVGATASCIDPGRDRGDAAATRAIACNLVWAAAVGAHLGSYFWSAIAKIDVSGGDPLFWVLHNPTQTAMALALERGDSPLTAWPRLLQAGWDGTIAAQPFLNMVVFFSQLLSPLAVVSVPVLATFCLLFDLFHVGVYVTLGSMFHFWVALNLVIAAAAATLRGGGFTPPMKAAMLLAILIGHYFFYTNHLGWLDTAKLVSPSVFAVTRDGRQVAVPGNYFGIYSYPLAQGVLYVPDGHFPFRLAGNTYDRASWDDGRTCGPQTVGHQETGVTLDAVRRMVLDTDRLMRRFPSVKSYNLYYVYPHHAVSNPWVYTAFNQLGIDDIVAYDYVVDSVCLTVRDGKLVRDVHEHSDFRIDLR